MHQVTTSLLSLYTPGQVKGAVENVFVPIGIPYLVKSMQAVHGIHT